MPQHRTMQRLALTLRRFPWTVVLARKLWRLRQAKFSVGVVGAAFDDTGRVLMVEHVFHPYTPWGLPGGWVEADEDPAETLRREFLEELDLPVTVERVIAVQQIERAHLDIAFLCRPHGQVGKLSFELLRHDWFDPAQLPSTHSFHQQAINEAQALVSSQSAV